MQTCPTCGADFDDGFACPYDGQRLVPKIIDRYRLLRRVAVGGMSEVFEAEHTFVNKRVALKILRRHLADDPEPAERMYREARAASSVGHHNIVRIEDFGRILGGEVYLVMEWLEGESLETILDSGGVSDDEALDIAIQACAGLGAAHDAGIVHRDVKPGNLFIASDADGARLVKIVDFGIAKLLSREFLNLTKSGALIGTPSYIAPEQARGESIDHRCDIYSLGVILYEMFAGVPPFAAEAPLELVRMHANETPLRPSEREGARKVAPPIETVIMRCLEKSPGDRYQSMAELRILLESLRTPRSTLMGVPVAAERTQQSMPKIDSEPLSGARQAADRPAPTTPPRQLPSPEEPTVLPPSGRTMELVEARRGRTVATAIALVSIVTAVIVGVAALSGAEEDGAAQGSAVAVLADASPSARGEDARARGADASPAEESIESEREPWMVVRTRRQTTIAVAALPRPLQAGQPILLDVAVTTERDSLARALAASEVRVDVRFLHYLRHEKTGTLRADVGSDGRFRLAMTVPQDGKYHLTFKLSSPERVFGRLQVDICVGADPGSPEAKKICPRLNSAHR